MKIFLLLVLLTPFFGFSLEQSKSLKKDSRIRMVNFHPNQVYSLNLKPGIATNIVFSKSERVINDIAGAEQYLDILKRGNNVFIKQIHPGRLNTNLTLITTKRVYYFQVSNRKKNPVFAIKFYYPTERLKQKQVKAEEEETFSDINPQTAEQTYSNFVGIGSKRLKPKYIFSSETHTFIKLDSNSSVPAVFKNVGTPYEQLVNSVFRDDWIIISDSSHKYTLRLGGDVLCIIRIDEEEKLKENTKSISHIFKSE